MMEVSVNTVMLAIVALVTACTPVMLAVINTRASRAMELLRLAGVDAASKAEAVRLTLQRNTLSTDLQLGKLAKVTHDTHTLVNANMGTQLKISAVALRRIAVMSKDPGDEAAALIAEEALRKHEEQQAIVDSDTRANTKDRRLNDV